jgi:ATP/maltotriose-dependent transcriptional regulator MalT
LFEHDATRAVQSLRHVWDHTVREGVDDPGAFPVAADLVEAFVESGELSSANEVIERLTRLATEQRHPWGLATAARCAAMVQLADRYLDRAAAELAEAAAAFGRMGLGFDHARSLLVLGRAQRRFKKRADARRSLEEAEAVFEQGGCHGWVQETRTELARVSGRPAADKGALTPSERGVAGLAANGLSNKQIAAQLFISVYTVEAHLKKAYSKLGIRSRSQLAGRLGGQ